MATNTQEIKGSVQAIAPMWLRYARAARAAFEMTLRQTVMDAFILFTVLIQPLIVALLALWMLRDKGPDYAIYIVIGSGLTGMWSGVLFICGNSITMERWTGTLETIVSLPTPIPVIIFGKNLANVLQSLLSMITGYVLAAVFFHYPLQIQQPLPFMISILFMIVSFIALGMLLAPAFLMNPAIRSWQNALEFPVYILAGFLFPIALLPGWTTPLSYLLAPYWAAQALKDSAGGNASLGGIAFSWLMLVVLTVIYALASRRLFRVVLRKARIDGTLGVE